jgi:hypothetical protein
VIRFALLMQCRRRLEGAQRKVELMQKQIDTFAHAAVEAADQGDDRRVQWMLKRLSAIHELFPLLLTDAHLKDLCNEVRRHGTAHDRDETRQELIERQREVAAQLNPLVRYVQIYYAALQATPRDAAAVAAAHPPFVEAAQALKRFDADWLAELTLEMDTFLNDIDDPAGKVAAQVNRFLASVGNTLAHLRHMVRDAQAQQRGPRPGR